jgi:hypothetical protein
MNRVALLESRYDGRIPAQELEAARAADAADLKTAIQTHAADLYEALSNLVSEADGQVYRHLSRMNFEAPDDHQFQVVLTAKLWRQIGAALGKVNG